MSPWQVELYCFDPQEAVVDHEVITQPEATTDTGRHEDDGSATDALLTSGAMWMALPSVTSASS